MKELVDISAAMKSLGDEPCALATVIQVEGSAYRQPGARMLLTPEGRSWGMISGGCLEHDVLHQARRCLLADEPRLVRYDSRSDDDALFGTGLGCHGVVDVFVEPVRQPFRDSFVHIVGESQHTRKVGAIATVIEGRLPDTTARHAFLNGAGWCTDDLLRPLLESRPLQFGVPVLFSGAMSGGEARVFVQPLPPPLQLIIFGGWLDALPLVHVAREMGFHTVVVDSRQRTASRQFFAAANSVLLAPPNEALAQIRVDARTVAVVMNHHLESDREALSALADVTLPFVGLLGPRHRRQRLLESLRDEGVIISDEFVRRLHGPVGLDLGATTPEHIALSIVAEILASLNGRDAEPIRNRLAPIHASTRALAYG